MTAIGILLAGIILSVLNAKFVRPDPQSNVFDPSMLYLQGLLYLVIAVGTLIALVIYT